MKTFYIYVKAPSTHPFIVRLYRCNPNWLKLGIFYLSVYKIDTSNRILDVRVSLVTEIESFNGTSFCVCQLLEMIPQVIDEHQIN
jgi:hypothetical protein